jgi:hypothetical protein
LVSFFPGYRIRIPIDIGNADQGLSTGKTLPITLFHKQITVICVIKKLSHIKKFIPLPVPPLLILLIQIRLMTSYRYRYLTYGLWLQLPFQFLLFSYLLDPDRGAKRMRSRIRHNGDGETQTFFKIVLSLPVHFNVILLYYWYFNLKYNVSKDVIKNFGPASKRVIRSRVGTVPVPLR